jgi:hypothetical protein
VPSKTCHPAERAKNRTRQYKERMNSRDTISSTHWSGESILGGSGTNKSVECTTYGLELDVVRILKREIGCRQEGTRLQGPTGRLYHFGLQHMAKYSDLSQ